MNVLWGTRWCSWLRHFAASRKVAVSNPDGFFGIFLSHNPSSLTLALGSTQPLTEMSTRNICWGVEAEGRADKITTFMCRLSLILGASTTRKLQGLSKPVAGTALSLLLYNTWHNATGSSPEAWKTIWSNFLKGPSASWFRWKSYRKVEIASSSGIRISLLGCDTHQSFLTFPQYFRTNAGVVP